MAKADPREINAILQSAKSALAAGQLQDAEAGLRKILAVSPRHAEATFHLGMVALRVGLNNEAAELFERSIAIEPKQIASYFALADARHRLGHLFEHVAALERALKLAPNNPTVMAQLANGMNLIGRYEDALDLADRAMLLQPQMIQLYVLKATSLGLLKRFDEAVAVCREVFKVAEEAKAEAPMMVTIAFAQMATQTGNEEEALERLARTLNRTDIHPRERMSAAQAAAVIKESQGEHKAAFDLFTLGNHASQSRWDPAGNSRFVDSMIEMCSREFLSGLPSSNNPSEVPVFIVGMPRSGTTLVEQILGCHESVCPLGELLDTWDTISAVARETRTKPLSREFFGKLTTKRLEDAARRFFTKHRKEIGGAARAIDKMPTNFAYLPFIASVFPQARVIHCRRDPMDTCWSNYATQYSLDLPFSHNLSHLGQYYRDYERLMEHYKSVLDLPILEVQYEELVADTEGQARRMLDFLGLDWDERVLRFNESDRRVLTASLAQVTQPIYTSSIGRHKPYEPMLGELKTALGIAEAAN